MAGRRRLVPGGMTEQQDCAQRMTLEDEVGLLSWIVLGFLAGLLARVFVPGSGARGCVSTTVIGILGSLVGGAIAGWLRGGDWVRSFNFTNLLVAAFGAIILLMIFR